MKRGNSILTEGCLRMRSSLSRRILILLMHPQILRKSLKETLAPQVFLALASRAGGEVVGADQY